MINLTDLRPRENLTPEEQREGDIWYLKSLEFKHSSFSEKLRFWEQNIPKKKYVNISELEHDLFYSIPFGEIGEHVFYNNHNLLIEKGVQSFISIIPESSDNIKEFIHWLVKMENIELRTNKILNRYLEYKPNYIKKAISNELKKLKIRMKHANSFESSGIEYYKSLDIIELVDIYTLKFNSDSFNQTKRIIEGHFYDIIQGYSNAMLNDKLSTTLKSIKNAMENAIKDKTEKDNDSSLKPNKGWSFKKRAFFMDCYLASLGINTEQKISSIAILTSGLAGGNTEYERQEFNNIKDTLSNKEKIELADLAKSLELWDLERIILTKLK